MPELTKLKWECGESEFEKIRDSLNSYLKDLEVECKLACKTGDGVGMNTGIYLAMKEAAILLNEFVKENFTGPTIETLEQTEKHDAPVLSLGDEYGVSPELRRRHQTSKEETAKISHLGECNATQRRVCLDVLTSDGEYVQPSLRAPLLLLVSKTILSSIPECQTSLVFGIQIWRMRSDFVHQRVLLHKSASLRRSIHAQMSSIQINGTGIPELLLTADPSSVDLHTIPLLKVDLPKASHRWDATPKVEQLISCEDIEFVPIFEDDFEKVRLQKLYLELGNVFDLHREVDSAASMFKVAQKVSGLGLSLSGQMGVRTEHQSFKTAQMTLEITFPEGEYRASPPIKLAECGVRPRVIQSLDCNVMQRPSNRNLVYKEETEEFQICNLKDEDQQLLISMCLNVKNSSPMHGLSFEECTCYLERLLTCNNVNYPFFFMILIVKSRIEARKGRVRERAVLQMQELLDVFNDPCGNREARIEGFHNICLPSYMELCKETARQYISFGMLKTAESLAESTQDWEFCIDCCLKQSNHKRAAHIATQLIEKEPNNALLYCCLAEATRSKEDFLKAWEISGCRLTRAMRGLAALCLDKKEYKECIEYFEQALRLNPVYGSNWFQMGYACIQLEEWGKGVEAYTRAVQIEPEDGQSWANLGVCFAKLNKMREALTAFGEATKSLESSTSVKHNHLKIAVALGEWRLCQQDFISLVTMNGRNYKIDERLLFCTVDGLVQQAARGETSWASIENLLQILDSNYTDVPAVYAAHSHYYKIRSQTVLYFEYLKKEFRALTIGGEWVKDMARVAAVQEVVSAISECAQSHGSEFPDIQIQAKIIDDRFKSALELYTNKAEQEDATQDNATAIGG